MVHQSRVKCCPLNFPAGFYWYGSNQKAQGKTAKWVEDLLGRHEGDDVTCVDDGMSDDNSEVVAPLQEQTDTQSSVESDAETDMPVEEESVVQLPVKMSRPRSNIAGYSLREKPRPSQKLIDKQARD